MYRALVVVALVAACRGEPRSRDKRSAGPGSWSVAAASAPGVPKLPYSDDGDAAMRALDAEIESAGSAAQRSGAKGGAESIVAATRDVELIGLLLQRAEIRGWLEDYTRALATARAAVAARPTDMNALAALGRAQLAVHAFADVRATLATLTDTKAAAEIQLSLDQATGKTDIALAARKARVDMFPDAASVTIYASTLAEADRAGEGIALIPTAVQHLRSNTPQYLAWLLFQWGLLYEQTGAIATARDFYAEAHRRLPAHVEATVHLALAIAATGNLKAARALVAGDLDRHPALLALDATMSGSDAKLKAATALWERYLAAFPAAFADHAARFYLGSGDNAARALELAQINLAARDTPAAHGLLIDAALAAEKPALACDAVGALATSGPRRERFLAWRAFTACRRTADAERLAHDLGIQGR